MANETTYRPLSTERVNFSGVSAQSAALGSGQSGSVTVRVWASSDCHIAVGSNPTATTSDLPLGSNIPEYLRVPVGQKIAVISQGTDGAFYATEVEG